MTMMPSPSQPNHGMGRLTGEGGVLAGFGSAATLTSTRSVTLADLDFVARFLAIAFSSVL
jgi:hypothetical protein